MRGRGGKERTEETQGFGCPSLSRSRALKLCVVVACRAPWGQGQWLASLGTTPFCSEWVPGCGLLDLPPPPPRMEPPPYGQVRKRKTGALCSWPVISGRVRPLNRCWWKEGTQTSGLDWPGTEFLHLRSGGEEHCWQLAALQEKLGDPGVLDHIPMG